MCTPLLQRHVKNPGWSEDQLLRVGTFPTSRESGILIDFLVSHSPSGVFVMGSVNLLTKRAPLIENRNLTEETCGR